MDTEMMIRNLKKVEEDHKDDKVFTGQLNISEMAHDVRKRLEELKPYEDTGLTTEQIMELKERDKPRKIELNAGVPICPVCGHRVVRCYDFCPDCGQRLKQ
ncbi:MAG: zinc ribbon domain-containing protein [Lachnospiraceae bacterium]|nr:zinc ribbon domain-containing protein [Lachnospiraceae bacterium]